jgi:hypothetical protein
VLWRHCGDKKQGRHILVSTRTFLSLASLHWHRMWWILAVEHFKVWTHSTHSAKAAAFASVYGLFQAEVCCSSGLIVLLCYHLFVRFRNAICRFAPNTLPIPVFLFSLSFPLADSFAQPSIVLAIAEADHRPRDNPLCASTRPPTRRRSGASTFKSTILPRGYHRSKVRSGHS